MQTLCYFQNAQTITSNYIVYISIASKEFGNVYASYYMC